MALFNKDPIPTKPATPTRRSETPSLLGNPPSSHTANMQKSSSSAKPNDGADPHPASESRLIVGPNIKLKGDRLVVHETGDVSGKIRYGRLSIEEGGRVHGDLDEIHSAEARAKEAPEKTGTAANNAAPTSAQAAE